MYLQINHSRKKWIFFSQYKIKALYSVYNIQFSIHGIERIFSVLSGVWDEE